MPSEQPQVLASRALDELRTELHLDIGVARTVRIVVPTERLSVMSEQDVADMVAAAVATMTAPRPGPDEG